MLLVASTSSDSQQESETYPATSDEEENATVMLDDWDQWMNDLKCMHLTFDRIMI